MFWVVAILHILFIAAIAVRLKKYFYNAPLIDFYYSALFFKLFAGVMLGVIYFYYYGEDNKGDTIGYHEYAKIITHDIRHNMSDAVDFIFFNKYHDQYTVFLKGSNRVKFFVTIVSFFHLLTGDNYWLSSIYFSLLSFYGCWLLANHLIQYFKFSKVSIILSLLFFPSFVFWGSGLLKESVSVAAITFVIYYVIQLKMNPNNVKVHLHVITLVSLLFLFFVKFYFFAVLISSVIAMLIVMQLKIQLFPNIFLNFIVKFIAVVCIPIIIISSIHPLLHYKVIMEVILHNYNVTILYSEGRNVFYFEGLNENPISIIQHVPKALWIGLFRPYIWEGSNVFSYLTGIENLFILIFAVFSFKNTYKFSRKYFSWFIALSFYIGVLAVLLPITSPNFGTLVRYKVSYLPFFLILIINGNILEKYIVSFFEKKGVYVFSEKTSL